MSSGITEQSYDQSLERMGIHATAVHYNPSYDDLRSHELDPAHTDFAKGRVTQSGAVAVDTGIYTGRSPKDKYIVKESSTQDDIWWHTEGSDNQPLSQEVWESLKAVTVDRLNGRDLFVIDGFCGANPATRLKVRLVTEVAWMAHFFKNMFIRPSKEELEGFEPDWTIFNACKTSCKDFKALGLNSSTYVAFHLSEKMTFIGGTWYGGEIKKGIFSVMNFFLPKQGIGSFHCSANEGKSGDTALFFGLSGTGKTTLSTDPERALIGDDEHGWDDEGVFNLEGGCYAKTIRLSEAQEPDIYHAIRQDALLENVVVDAEGKIDFDSNAKTENTRVSYPLYHIDNVVKPVSKGGHPKRIIFLTCDAYGVLPPVSCLSTGQALYQFISGYTAKIAGTERGVTEPQVCFSACFGQPFLLMHPTVYAEILGQKIEEHGAKAYFVNTGWSGGPYGVGKRISLKNTRAIIHAILDGSIDEAEMATLDYFNMQVPKMLNDVDRHILMPRDTWEDKAAYDEALKSLAIQFVENFKRFNNTRMGKEIASFGPGTEAL